MKRNIILLLILLSTQAFGNALNVSGISFNSATNQLSFTLSWENSWAYFAPEPDLYDAAWVWVKYAPNGGDTWQHAEILDSVPVQNYVQYISYDDLGIMVYKNSVGSSSFGPQEFTLELAPLAGGYQDFKVFATEMVFIDDGDFYAGDITSPGRFYMDGNITTPWLIESEDAIARGPGVGEFDQLNSLNTQDINANFPKGWNSFFCMKYKITAQQYVDFLNCLTRAQQDTRVRADLSGSTASNKYVMTNSALAQDRNPIACDVNIGTGPIEFFVDLDPTNPENSANDGGNIVLNHLAPTDVIAYLDWSGMRPMTELEYEKICRGTGTVSVAGEYAWGTDTWNDAGGIISSGTAGESTANVGVITSLFSLLPLRAGYAATAVSGRTESSATFWGVMDMHNLGELIYGVESSNFTKASYGDGNLDALGNAIVNGWTMGAQLLSTIDPALPGIEPVSKGKTSINPLSGSAYWGARGIRKLIRE